jgi:hypothetical protein
VSHLVLIGHVCCQFPQFGSCSSCYRPGLRHPSHTTVGSSVPRCRVCAEQQSAHSVDFEQSAKSAVMLFSCRRRLDHMHARHDREALLCLHSESVGSHVGMLWGGKRNGQWSVTSRVWGPAVTQEVRCDRTWPLHRRPSCCASLISIPPISPLACSLLPLHSLPPCPT